MLGRHRVSDRRLAPPDLILMPGQLGTDNPLFPLERQFEAIESWQVQERGGTLGLNGELASPNLARTPDDPWICLDLSTCDVSQFTAQLNSINVARIELQSTKHFRVGVPESSLGA